MVDSLVQFRTNDQLDQDEREEVAKRDAAQVQASPLVSSLTSHVLKRWEAAKTAKLEIERKHMRIKRMLRGEYEPDKLAKIRARGGASVYMRLADEKSTALKAWLIDILLPADEEPWGVSPTPVPDLPPEQHQSIEQSVLALVEQDMAIGVEATPEDVVNRIQGIAGEIQQQLAEAAKEVERKVETKIKDVIVESNWRQALKDFIFNLVDYKASFLKGPVFRMGKEIVWDENGSPQVVDKINMEFEAPNPVDMFPSPSSKNCNDGYLFQKHSLTRKSLVAMKGVKGYDSQAIDNVLRDYGNGGLKRWIYETRQNEVDRLSERPHAELDPEGTIDALQFWGSIQGLSLLEHGIEVERVPDLFAEYEVEVWQIGNYVIKAELNGNLLGDRGYYKASFRKKTDQFWGDSLPEVIEDNCDVCNAAARNMVNNAGMISGPQIGVDKNAMPAGEIITNITPLKVWQFHLADVANGGKPPIWFFQPKSMINDLIKLYEFFSDQADNRSGVPKYSYGQSSGGGAINTATGFSMMMSNASRGIKLVISNIDEVIEGSVKGVYTFLRLNDPDPVLRMGDIKLIPKGSSSLVAKEQTQIRRNEFLQTALHPLLSQIIGPEGLAKMTRKVASGLDMGGEDIVPSDEDLKRLVLQQAGPQNNGKGTNTNPAGDRMGGQDARTV
jgi:hypothetical protein